VSVEAALPLFQPYLGPEVHAATTAALDAGWLAMGPLTQEFEARAGKWLELPPERAFVSTSSCTAALHMACELIGLGPGDEVIMPSFTYVAGHQAATASGADVVFCDIEEARFGADPAAIDALVSDRTRAVMVTHFAGGACDIDGIRAVASKHGLRVIEDAAHAFGTRHDGRPLGATGDVTCFSFGPAKVMTTLEGGAIIAPGEEDVQTLHELRLLGIDSDTAARYARGRNWEYDVSRQGFRYHLGSIPASIGLSQLALLDGWIAHRQRACRAYDDAFADVPEVRPVVADWTDVSPFIYVVRVPAEARDDLMAALRADGIGTGIHFLGAHEFTFYKGCRRDDLALTERVSQEVVSLPLHGDISDASVARVAEAVRKHFGA
jgi:dTDP-4-amino-4,6-dideoxygalactose transaminase